MGGRFAFEVINGVVCVCGGSERDEPGAVVRRFEFGDITAVHNCGIGVVVWVLQWDVEAFCGRQCGGE